MLPSTQDARDSAVRVSGSYARVSREARLRPEYARLYPGISAGEWQPAATLTDRVLAHHLLYALHAGPPTRRLLEKHFEFRGGESGPREGKRTGDR